jgi:hypothetical protein
MGTELGSPSFRVPSAMASSEQQAPIIFARSPAVAAAALVAAPSIIKQCDPSLSNAPCSSSDIRLDISRLESCFLISVICGVMSASVCKIYYGRRNLLSGPSAGTDSLSSSCQRVAIEKRGVLLVFSLGPSQFLACLPSLQRRLRFGETALDQPMDGFHSNFTRTTIVV